MSRTVVGIGLLLAMTNVFGAARASDSVTGAACYHYSDNESLDAARDIVLSLAKRDAIESYSVFVTSSSLLENTQLRNDAISSVGAAVLHDLETVAKDENLAERKVCVTIKASIDPIQAKEAIGATVAAFQNRTASANTGLPSNPAMRVLRADRKQSYGRDYERLVVYCSEGLEHRMAEARKNWGPYSLRGTPPDLFVRMTALGIDGIPIGQSSRMVKCNYKGDIEVYEMDLPQGTATIQIELVEHR